MLRKIALLITLLILCSPYTVSKAQSPQPQVSQVEIAQVDNSAYPDVTLYLRVLDDRGDRVGGLNQGDFNLTVYGKPVEIINFTSFNTDAIHTILVIDKSSSMDVENKLKDAKSSANTFIDLMEHKTKLR